MTDLPADHSRIQSPYRTRNTQGFLTTVIWLWTLFLPRHGGPAPACHRHGRAAASVAALRRWTRRRVAAPAPTAPPRRHLPPPNRAGLAPPIRSPTFARSHRPRLASRTTGPSSARLLRRPHDRVKRSRSALAFMRPSRRLSARARTVDPPESRCDRDSHVASRAHQLVFARASRSPVPRSAAEHRIRRTVKSTNSGAEARRAAVSASLYRASRAERSTRFPHRARGRRVRPAGPVRSVACPSEQHIRLAIVFSRTASRSKRRRRRAFEIAFHAEPALADPARGFMPPG